MEKLLCRVPFTSMFSKASSTEVSKCLDMWEGVKLIHGLYFVKMPSVTGMPKSAVSQLPAVRAYLNFSEKRINLYIYAKQ